MFLPKERGAQKMVCGNMETETSMSSLDQLYDEHPEKVKKCGEKSQNMERSKRVLARVLVLAFLYLSSVTVPRG